MKIPYELIAKYIRNECSSDEIHTVEKWMNSSAENRRMFLDLKSEWRHLKDSSPEIIPDKEEMWNAITRRLESSYNSFSGINFRRRLVAVAAIAAAVALFLSIGGMILYQRIFKTQTLETAVTEVRCPNGQKARVFLPDGTSVWLNSGTSLKYDGVSFNQKERNVELKGEAFFEVTKNPKKKFTVKTSNINVSVLGTSFDVSAYDDEPSVKVSLLKGSVSLSVQHSGESLGQISPNQMAIVDKKSMKSNIVPDDAALTSLWTQNTLRIYDDDILSVSKKLERWYGVNIHIQNPNLKPRYSFAVKTESLRELFQLLNKITPMKYTIEGEEVNIK